MAADVLPCPFCGAAGTTFKDAGLRWFAHCTNDECDSVSTNKPTEAEAIAAWNRRAPAAAAPATREADEAEIVRQMAEQREQIVQALASTALAMAAALERNVYPPGECAAFMALHMRLVQYGSALLGRRATPPSTAPATREADDINNRAQAIYDALHERGFGADNGGRKLALFHAILDGLTCKLDADGERIAPPAAAPVEVAALLREAKSFVDIAVAAERQSQAFIDIGYALSARLAAALAAAGPRA